MILGAIRTKVPELKKTAVLVLLLGPLDRSQSWTVGPLVNGEEGEATHDTVPSPMIIHAIRFVRDRL